MTKIQTDKFGNLVLEKRIVAALKEMGFEEPSPIQQQAIPLLLEGKDIIGQAQTGTGKTAAFGIPIIQGIEDKRHIQALVMSPTRELAIQVAEEIETDELQRWHMYVRPYQDECEVVPQPKTKEELVMTAKTLGIEWDIDELLDLGE